MDQQSKFYRVCFYCMLLKFYFSEEGLEQFLHHILFMILQEKGFYCMLR